MKRNSQIFLSVVCSVFALCFLLLMIDDVTGLAEACKYAAIYTESVLFQAAKRLAIIYFICDVLGIGFSGFCIYKFLSKKGDGESYLSLVTFMYPASRAAGIFISFNAMKKVAEEYGLDYHMGSNNIVMLVFFFMIIASSLVAAILVSLNHHKESFIVNTVSFVLTFVSAILLLTNPSATGLVLIFLIFLILACLGGVVGTILAFIFYGQKVPVKVQPSPVDSVKPVEKHLPSLEEKLLELKRLKELGLINDTDYEAKKKKLLEDYI